MRAVRLFCVLAPLALASCSWIQATPGDHAAYRRTRIERTFAARLAAAHRYLEERPTGAYAEDVRRYFDRAEPVFFAKHERDEPGLRAYLDALPRGPHAAEARSRLRVLEERRKSDPMLAAATVTRERLERAKKSRLDAQEALSRWLKLTLDRAAFAGPLSEAPKDLLIAFSLALPEPVCAPAEGADLPDGAARVCMKDAVHAYAIPVEKRLEDRELAFVVELTLDEAGRPLRASFAGGELFSRLDETFTKEERRAESVRERIEAVGRAVDFVGAAFEERVSVEPSCAKPVVAPEVLHLACGGLRVRARAGAGPGDSDEIVVEPLP